MGDIVLEADDWAFSSKDGTLKITRSDGLQSLCASQVEGPIVNNHPNPVKYSQSS
jgi:hypothetical protein